MRISILLFLLTAGLAAQAASPPDGQAVFKQRCAICHNPQKMAASIRDEAAADKREAYLRKFLVSHHPPRTAAEREALIAYLVKLAAN